MKIYIIDDSSFVRNQIAELFHGNMNFETIELEKLPKFNEAENWVFLELDFDRELSGLQALEFVSDNPGQNFVVLAAPGEERLVEQAIQSGARDFLFKPLKKSELLRVFAKIQT
ncbi:MAG: response regulator [Candidatus Wallbacteria bacterium]|nr:response regulator [Candidatus Wallbacteria bacterium]